MNFRKSHYLVLFSCFLSIWGCDLQENHDIETLSGEKIDCKTLDNFFKSQMDSLEIIGLSIAIINNAEIVYHRT
jgi:hypothetical protein